MRGHDVDAFGALALPALAGYLQEVAARHAVALGCGVDALRARGLTWVLMRLRVAAPEPVAAGDVLAIDTWPSGVDRLLVSREYLVRRGEAVVARASTAWLVVDLASRRPVRPADALDPALRPAAEILLPIARRLPAAEAGPGAIERRFGVRYQDIDANQHVNNATYLAWALEAVEPARWRAQRAAAAEIHFLAEACLGDTVVSRAAGAGEEVRHAILREGDGAELARAVTRWTARAGPGGGGGAIRR